jgi:hypothetical protein
MSYFLVFNLGKSYEGSFLIMGADLNLVVEESRKTYFKYLTSIEDLTENAALKVMIGATLHYLVNEEGTKDITYMYRGEPEPEVLKDHEFTWEEFNSYWKICGLLHKAAVAHLKKEKKGKITVVYSAEDMRTEAIGSHHVFNVHVQKVEGTNTLHEVIYNFYEGYDVDEWKFDLLQVSQLIKEDMEK